jgi:hypothetical protein
MPEERHEQLPGSRHGADDENPRSDFRAMAKKITWWQATEIIRFTDRQMWRWHSLIRLRSSSRDLSKALAACRAGLATFLLLLDTYDLPRLGKH